MELSADGIRFGALVEAGPDAMVVVDTTGRILLVNAQTERLFGYERKELVGQPVELLMPEHLRARHEHVLGAVDLSARRKDGGEFPVEIALSPLETDDGVLVVSSAIRDVTLARERLLERYEEAARMKAVGELAAGVSHDFKHVLGLAKNYTKFVRKTLTLHGVDIPQVTADISTILSVINQGEHLSRQLALMGRPHASENLTKHPAEVIARVVDVCLFDGVEITLEPLPEIPAVNVDVVELEQALFNLLFNGRDACAGDGRIIVRAYLSKNTLTIEVIDNGCGMSAETMRRMYEPYFTTKVLGSGRSAEDVGTGLGLGQVYRIAQEADGRIRASSTLGVGTTFVLKLPLRPEIGP